MVENWLVQNVWAAWLLVVAAYCVDHTLGAAEAHLYHAHIKGLVTVEASYQPAVGFKEDNSRLRIFTSRFLLILLFLSLGLMAAWYALLRWNNLPEVFAVLLGGLVLMEAAGAMRHYRYVSAYRYIRGQGGIQGEDIRVSRRLFVTLQYVELYAFTALFALIFLFTGSWFFLGGALTCFITSRRVRDWAVILHSSPSPR